MNIGTVGLALTLLRTTAMLALAVLLVRALLGRLRPASPTVWRIACVLALLQGVVVVRLSVKVPWVERMKSNLTTAAPSVERAQPHVLPDSTAVASSTEGPPSAGSAPQSAPVAGRRGGPPSIGRSGQTWSNIVLVAWLTGMAGILGGLLVGYIRFVAGLKSRPPDDPAWAEEWSSLLTERGVRRPIALRVTDQTGPMLCRLPDGYAVIVPEWLWRRLDPSARQAILLHELAHYARGDLWKSLAIRVLALPHWFNPFAWWAVRTFDECGEWACDDVVISPEPCAGAGYARVLLQLGELSNRRPSFGLRARGSSLATRVRRLVQPRPVSESTRTRWIVIGTLIVLVVFQLVRPELTTRSSLAAQSATVKTDLYGDPLPAGALARLGTVRFRNAARIDRIAITPEGKTLACWDMEGTLSLFEVTTGKRIRRHPFPTFRAHVLTYHPGGKSLAVIGSSDDVVHLWDFADEREPVPKSGPMPARRFREGKAGDDRETFGTFAVSSDGRLLAGGSNSGYGERAQMIRLWNVTTGKRLDELESVRDFDRRPGSILWIAFSPDARTLFSLSGHSGSRQGMRTKSGQGVLYTWDAAKGVEIRHFEVPLPHQHGQACVMDISPDGRLMAISPDRRYLTAEGEPTDPIHLIRLEDGTELRQIDPGERMHVLAFSRDGTRFLSGGEDNTARVWDVATGRPLGEPIKHRRWVEAVAITADGRTAASAGQDGVIRIWDVNTTREHPQPPAHQFWLWSAALSPDGGTAITSALGETIRVWDAATGRPRNVISVADGPIAMALSPDGRVLAVSSGNPAEVRLLNPDSGRLLRRLAVHSRGANDSLAFSRDGSRIVAAGGQDQTLRLWDVATGRSLGVFKHDEAVRAAAISPDGTIVAGVGYENKVGGAGRVIRIWDATTGRQVRQLRGHKEWVNALAFSPDGKLLASGGFSVREGVGLGGENLGSPDLSDSIHLWDVATWKDIRQFPGEPTANRQDRRAVDALAFTPDGRTLISGEQNGSIVLYDVSNASVRATLRGHESGVRALGVSSDGRRLVSACMDLTGLIWDLPRAIERGIAH